MLFGLLNLPSVQEYAKKEIISALKDKIDSDLGLKKLSFQPFNTIKLDSLYLNDQSGNRILLANEVSASIDLFALLNKKIVINSARLSDFDIRLSKAKSDTSLNIQYIIDAFKSDDQQPKSSVAIKLSTIHLTHGQFSYDVLDKEIKEHGFDASHILVSDLDAKLSLKSLLSDSLNIQLKNLNLVEKSGIEIVNLTTRFITQDKKAYLKGFRLDLPSSYLEFEKCEIDISNKPDSAGVSILDYAVLDCIIAPSYIAPKDASAFVPALQYFDDLLTLQGHISGTLGSMKIENLALDLGDKMHLIANAELTDVKDASKMYILGRVDKLMMTYDGIEGLTNNFSQNKNKLPKEIERLGTVSFRGEVSGHLDRLTANGSLNTELGKVNTDILFGFNTSYGLKSFLQGKIYTADFNIGKLLDNNDLDQISLDIEVDIKQSSQNKLKGNVKGNVYNFSYKNYVYENIAFDGNYDGLRVDGKLLVNTAHGALDINGLFDLSDKKRPELDVLINARNIELDDLKLAPKLHDSNLSFAMHANFKGSNIDDMVGYVKIDSVDFVREDKFFHLDHFFLDAVKDETENRLTLTSDVIDGEVNGTYSFTTMVQSILRTLHPYMPALIKPSNISEKNEKLNDLKFKFEINNTEALSNILNLPVTVISPSKITGNYNNITNNFLVEVFAPHIVAGGKDIKSGYVLARNASDHIDTKIDASILGKNDVITNIVLASKIVNNQVNTNISLSNNGAKKTKGAFSLSTNFSRQKQNALQVDIDILPSEALLNEAIWKLDKSHICIFGDEVSVDKFTLSTIDKSQEIKIDGDFSLKNPKSVLKAQLKSIDLGYVFETLSIEALRFSGQATGDVFISSIEGKPYANTNLEVHNFGFNHTQLGTLKLFSELDEKTNYIILDGTITNELNKRTTVDGYIDPLESGLSLHFGADSIDIGFLGLYAKSIFDHVEGRGSGNVHLYGDFSNVTVEGEAYISNGNIGISFLNTDYTFSDSIHLKKDLIYFNDITFTDKHGNIAIGDGKVSHDFFSNFAYNVELTADKFLVYNMTPKENPLFYGKVFASGKGSIGGDESAVDIDISMRTDENTSVRMNFMKDVINEYNFITYKDSAPKDTISENKRFNPIETKSGMAINMNFYIDATPDAQVEILMDPTGGDIIQGNGNGTIQFLWNTKDSPRLYGTYNINRGSYNFTFQRLMERKFSIEDGSSIQFKGDPFEATLNVEAIYKVTANLNDLDRDLVKTTGQSSIPVNCILKLAGPLKQPNVGLDLAFPRSDAEVERQVKSMMNTEDMINRQVTYLLLLSKFYTPSYAMNEHRTSDFAAVASATLSNQLTKIVSQIDKRWQLGTNIRTSDAEFTSTEVELILSSQLLNNRLLINGNFGYRDDPSIQANNAFIGDIDLELLLNNSGTWRVKAYNHYNEKYYYNPTSTQTQGIGLMYKRSFDKVQELFFWKRRKNKLVPDNKKKPDAPDNDEPDSFVKYKK